MDPIALAYYAIVCGALSCCAPLIGGILARLAIGVVVGLVAAALLPMLRAAF